MVFNFSVNAQKFEQPIHIQSSLRKSAKTSDTALEWSAFAALSPSCIMALNSASVISTRTSVLLNPIYQISYIGLCVGRESYRSRIQTNRLPFVSSIYEYA